MELRFRVTRKRVAIFAAALALVATGAAIGVTSNAYTDANGVYKGCVDKSGGNLRVLTPTGQSCKNNEVAIDWNQVGPQGIQGIQGEKGDKGDKGEVGLAQHQFLQGTLVSVAANGIGFASVSCPAGKRVLGGGGHVAGTVAGAGYLWQSIPTSNTSWRVAYKNMTGANISIWAYAVCATVSS